ncbi:MAG: DNA polymerase IV [Candidatus Nanohaloarchaeota archaeon QJJ-9]|nr:DNA polymerase IV [Candidatus Nanohaloarchaeota archaeon QJJ-9]
MGVIHVDMDAFFASIEVRDNPELEGKPVVVGADPESGNGRGVVSTCNYEARRYGINSGMPVSKAYERCKGAEFVPVDKEKYNLVSKKVMRYLSSFGDSFEKASIDEAFFGFDSDDFKELEDIGEKISQGINQKFDLSCSVGVSPNKLVSKIASDEEKPGGLVVVRPSGVRDFLNPKKAKVIPGVGKKTWKELQRIGVTSVKDLASMKRDKLRERFGKHGLKLRRRARGIDNSSVGGGSGKKSFGSETTFRQDINDFRTLKSHLRILKREIGSELNGSRYGYSTVVVKLRRSDFETFTRQRSLGSCFRDVDTAYKTGCELLEKLYGGDYYRLIGLRVKDLEKSSMSQSRLGMFL